MRVGRRSAASPVTSAVEPLEAEGEVRAALVAGERVDLVDDHRVAPPPSISRPVREVTSR